MDVATCGSLPSRGLPVVVRLPASTQELDPISPLVRGSSHGRSTAPISPTDGSGARVAAPAVGLVPGSLRIGAGLARAAEAFGSNRPSTTDPRLRIGSKPSSG